MAMLLPRMKMTMRITALHLVLASIAIPSCIARGELPSVNGDQLQVGFYKSTCPRAEEIVANVMAKYHKNSDATVPGVIRLFFHDCIIKGCDASILVKNTTDMHTEMEHIVQRFTLRGFDAIDAAKADVEKDCPGTVSCADILAFAARDATVLMGSPSYPVPAGRRDSLTSNIWDANVLPGPNWNVSAQIDLFAQMGFSVDELVVLLGSHSIGISHCWSSFALASFTLVNLPHVEPLIDRAYKDEVIHKLCDGLLQKPISWFQTLPFDPSNGTLRQQKVQGSWGTVFYKNILAGKEPVPSDLALALDPRTKPLVMKYANNPKLWAQKFNDAMIKLGKLNVLTGQQGTIRKVCGVLKH